MARLHGIVVDCRHPASLARFWAATLDGYAVAPYDEAESTRLRANGINDPEDDPSVLVEPVDGGGPRLIFQLVPEGRPDEPRTGLHSDLMPALGLGLKRWAGALLHLHQFSLRQFSAKRSTLDAAEVRT